MQKFHNACLNTTDIGGGGPGAHKLWTPGGEMREPNSKQIC